MANVTTIQILPVPANTLLYKIRITNLSDGTAETNAIKITKSGLVLPQGGAPSSLNIVSFRWAIQGMSAVVINWDSPTTQQGKLVLSGNGYENYLGNVFPPNPGAFETSPGGGTGNIILSTLGSTNGSSYDITLTCSMVA